MPHEGDMDRSKPIFKPSAAGIHASEMYEPWLRLLRPPGQTRAQTRRHACRHPPPPGTSMHILERQQKSGRQCGVSDPRVAAAV
jgi:hypothetical protein